MMDKAELDAIRGQAAQARFGGGAARPAAPAARRAQVVSKAWFPAGLPAGTAYVGRGSPYGNRHAMRSEADRGAVCDAHEADVAALLRDPAFVARMMRDLDGKDLACFCKRRSGPPVRCHADAWLREVGARTRFPALYCAPA